MKSLLLEVKESLKNPLVKASLLLGLLGAAPLWYSGIFLGEGQEWLGLLLFLLYLAIYTVDCLVTLTIILKRDK